MSTAYPFKAETLAEAIKQHQKSVVVDRASIESFSDHATQFTSLLQTSLDTPTILSIFSQQAEKIIPFAGITFLSAESDEIIIGNKERHSCSYQLTLEKEVLGEISISRKQRFSEEDLIVFENLITLLLYPLRNCLQFQQAKQAASKDAMTGLYNRRSMDERIAHESKMSIRYDSPLAMMVIDIDHFKLINDQYGHASGDCIIKALADIMMNTARTTDHAFRYGGEEFVMLLPNTSYQGAQLVADRIRESVELTECICQENSIKMTVSIGISNLQKDDHDNSLFMRADDALYEAKHSGRNQVCSDN